MHTHTSMHTPSMHTCTHTSMHICSHSQIDSIELHLLLGREVLPKQLAALEVRRSLDNLRVSARVDQEIFVGTLQLQKVSHRIIATVTLPVCQSDKNKTAKNLTDEYFFYERKFLWLRITDTEKVGHPLRDVKHSEE